MKMYYIESILGVLLLYFGVKALYEYLTDENFNEAITEILKTNESLIINIPTNLSQSDGNGLLSSFPDGGNYTLNTLLGRRTEDVKGDLINLGVEEGRIITNIQYNTSPIVSRIVYSKWVNQVSNESILEKTGIKSNQINNYENFFK